MKKLFLIFVIILIDTQITFSIQWKVFGDLNNIRNHPQAVKISDYEAMVIGGLDNNGTGISSCEIINIKDSTIKNAANLNLGRGWFTTQQDKNGNIYAIGGLISNWDIAVNSIEKYDLLTKQWTIIGSLLNNRAIFASIFLNDSLILVVGGESDGKISINSCEIFNINTGKSRYTSNYPYQVNYHILGRTSNDEIICVGGRIGSINSARTNDIYRFDQISETWVLYGKTNSKFTNSSGLRLNKGNYIFSGGSISESPLNINNEIYKDDNNSIKFLSNMNFKRNWHKLAEFNDSTIIIAGGFDENDNNIHHSIAS